MELLEAREAAYARRSETIVSPVTLSIAEGAHVAHACETARSACVLAMMAAGLARPTSGTIFVGAFDPCIQPVQVKRIVGYVAHEVPRHDFASFTRYVEYRAALWGLPRAQSIVRAHALLSKLEGVHDQFAYPLAGALLGSPRLLVLDRPPSVYARKILDAAGSCAIFSTHASPSDAERFAGALAIA